MAEKPYAGKTKNLWRDIPRSASKFTDDLSSMPSGVLRVMSEYRKGKVTDEEFTEWSWSWYDESRKVQLITRYTSTMTASVRIHRETVEKELLRRQLKEE